MLASQSVIPIPIIVPGRNEPPLDVFLRCGGYYSCPKRKDGTRIGKLVPFAGLYGEPPRNYVGDHYANFGVMKDQPEALQYFAEGLVEILRPYLSRCTTICGVPTGGRLLGQKVADACGKRFSTFTKRVIVAEADQKEDYVLEPDSRHYIQSGDIAVIIEDILNNAANTHKAVEAVEKDGGKVILLGCFLNRSVLYDTDVPLKHSDRRLPMISLVRKKMPQYRQDAPEVAEDMASGNICWHVKPEWESLVASMKLNELAA